ncbi:hypothetical protein ACO0LD_31800, partial [Undibacterium sp. Ji83W]|uniref:hypothetical protein n=1 Tax=Undibacterium sp. Ji83W TaxID=3413043 RepID=UPI003BF446C5
LTKFANISTWLIASNDLHAFLTSLQRRLETTGLALQWRWLFTNTIRQYFQRQHASNIVVSN